MTTAESTAQQPCVAMHVALCLAATATASAAGYCLEHWICGAVRHQGLPHAVLQVTLLCSSPAAHASQAVVDGGGRHLEVVDDGG